MLNKDITETYKNLYGLSELVYKEKVDFDFFRLYQKNYRFVVISIYNEKKEFLLLRDINKNIGWELPGGHVKENESIEDAVNRIVFTETGLTIDELHPISVVKNIFEWNNQTVIHYGLAFAALARGRIKPQLENMKSIYVKQMPEKIAYQDRKILQRTKEIIESKVFEPPYNEIEKAHKFFLFYMFHKYFVKALGKLASRKIEKNIIKLISDNPKTILDSSCGDDSLIFNLEKMYRPKLCIANDISWETICLIKDKVKNSNILFTNHNFSELPFKQKFDLLLFKNTLHHIGLSEQIDLVKNLSRLSKQLIIVDIEDPNKSNFLSKLWHWYYVHLLRDQGESFLTFGKFKEIIKENINGKEINFGIINTIKGRYFYASLLDLIKGEEVEIKVAITSSQVKSIKEKLFASGAYSKGKIKETDIYFTAPHRDFIKTKECLRIRERDNYLEVTYKGPSTRTMKDKKQFWKSEVNIPFLSSKKEVERLFESIDFKKVAEVIKEREKFTLGKQEITIDSVKDIGCFLEIETIITNKNERQKALNENMGLLKKLNLNEKNIITEPYRDLVIKKCQGHLEIS